jgi:hypothetical protein
MLKVNYFLSLIFCIIISNFSLSQNRCLERVKQEAVKVDSIQYSTGTGFLINNDGYIVTNRHVIEKSKNLTVTLTVSGKKIEKPAKLIDYSYYDDLAILKIDVTNLYSNLTPYSLKKEELSLGNKIFTLGYPDPSYMGTNIKLTDGLVNATTGFQDSETEYQISAPIQGGNSGSPMFDGDGYVRGIIVASYTAGQNVNYAIKVQKLIELLDANKIKYSLAKPTVAFKSNLSTIQSRICMINNTSKKSYYPEFSSSILKKNDQEINMMSKSRLSNAEFYDCFENDGYKPFGLFGGTKEKNWKDGVDVEDIFRTDEEQIIYRARFLNVHGFNALDAQMYFNQLYNYGAYENLIEEHDKNFNLNSDEVDFFWFSEYADPGTFHFFDSYYWTYLNQYCIYEVKNLYDLDYYIENLYQINEKFAKQSVVYDVKGEKISKSNQVIWTNKNKAHILQYKIDILNKIENFYHVDEDKCEIYSIIQSILSSEDIWVEKPTCN